VQLDGGVTSAGRGQTAIGALTATTFGVPRQQASLPAGSSRRKPHDPTHAPGADDFRQRRAVVLIDGTGRDARDGLCAPRSV
jgi:hypothetical protein